MNFCRQKIFRILTKFILKKTLSIISLIVILFAIIFAYKTFQANKNFNPELFIENSKNEDIYISINGKLYHRKDAKISVFDSGFLLGDGVWEGIRLHKSKLVFIEEH